MNCLPSLEYHTAWYMYVKEFAEDIKKMDERFSFDFEEISYDLQEIVSLRTKKDSKDAVEAMDEINVKFKTLTKKIQKSQADPRIPNMYISSKRRHRSMFYTECVSYLETLMITYLLELYDTELDDLIKNDYSVEENYKGNASKFKGLLIHFSGKCSIAFFV